MPIFSQIASEMAILADLAKLSNQQLISRIAT
jgi:hypothetical protein